MFGRKHSEESKQKMREWRTGWRHSEASIEKMKKFQAKHAKEIICYETKTVYKSIREAAEKNSLKECGLIAACNLFPNRTCGGFHWYRLEDYPIDYECVLPPSPKKPRPVIRLDTLVTYSSIREAARSCDLDPRNISKCCRGKMRTLDGTKWKFLEEYERECVTCNQT